jgi:hypothetical protein
MEMLVTKFQIRIQYGLMINKDYAMLDSIIYRVLNYLEDILFQRLLMHQQLMI